MSFDAASFVKVVEGGTLERRVPLTEFAEVITPLLAVTPGSYSDEEAVDAVAAALVDGTGIVISYNDGLDQITINCSITQYTDGDADARVAAGIATHEAAPDPHPGYLTTAEGNAAYSAVGHDHDADYEPLGAVASAISTHEGAVNPHPTYLTQAEGDALYSPLAHTHSGLPAVGVATADFGAFPGSQMVLVTVSGQNGLIASSKIQAWIAPIATADHGIDDHICESQFLQATPYYSVDGTFIIQVETINPPQTRYPPARQGDKYRVWDDFSIGWSWAN